MTSTFRRRGGLALLAFALLTAAVLVWLALEGREREQRTIARILTTQGETLIRAVEAARRMGMRGQEGRQFRLRFLMDEMVRQGELRFLVLIDAQGDFEALSEAEPGLGITAGVLASLPASPEPAWKIMEVGGEQVFVVYRHSRPPRRFMHNGMERGRLADPTEERALVAVGLDASLYLRAARKDALTLVMAGSLGLALAFAAAVTLYWRRKVAGLEREVVRQERMAALGTLAAGVAHEIRNPLSSIKGFATYFGAKFEPGTKDHALAEVMIGETERLNRVVTELLELTHPSELRLAPASVQGLVQHALKLVENDCRDKGIAVQTRIGQLDSALLDADRMLQILLNLFLNAIQAMPKGGTLTVSAQRTKDRLELCVADTGHGIAAQDLGRIFDPYFTTKNQGTGLGLATVRTMVEAHGGQVRVVSEPGRGTQVILDLPFTGVTA